MLRFTWSRKVTNIKGMISLLDLQAYCRRNHEILLKRWHLSLNKLNISHSLWRLVRLSATVQVVVIKGYKSSNRVYRRLKQKISKNEKFFDLRMAQGFKANLWKTESRWIVWRVYCDSFAKVLLSRCEKRLLSQTRNLVMREVSSITS